MADFRPTNPETDDQDNREPGIVKVPGSNLAKEMQKFEQFPTEWGAPKNPYVYRPFPKMLYRAQLWNGKAFCMAPDPNRLDFKNSDEYRRKLELARKFTEECQRIVKNEAEMHKAMESGWRESPQEAVEYLEARERGISDMAAHRNYEDRNMSEAAKREIAAASEEVGGEHLAEIPAKPVRRRRKVTPRKKTTRRSKG